MNVTRVIGGLGCAWGVLGITLLLASAIVRLTPIAWDALSYSLSWYHWLALAANIVFMAYAEGYRGFQQKFSPRVAARCRHLKQQPTVLHVLLAPLFCMGFFYTTKRRQMITILVTLAIILMVQVAHSLPQPWRGIVDAGVVIGLLWGLVSLLLSVWQALTRSHYDYSAELPPLHSSG